MNTIGAVCTRLGANIIDEQLPDLGTKFVEDVSVDDAEETLRVLAEEGHKLIFRHSPGI